MKLIRLIAFLSLVGVVAVVAQEADAPAEQETAAEAAAEAGESEAIEGLGMTQGKFAVLVIHEARAERFFEGEITGTTAAEKLATLGLAPEGGWKVNQELTRGDLETAYQRLMAQTRKGEEEAAEEDLSDITIAELIDKIVEEMKKVFATISTERLPVSPTGWNWK
jgi:hypothetical protein